MSLIIDDETRRWIVCFNRSTKEVNWIKPYADGEWREVVRRQPNAIFGLYHCVDALAAYVRAKEIIASQRAPGVRWYE